MLVSVCSLSGFEKEIKIEPCRFGIPIQRIQQSRLKSRSRATMSGGAMTTSPILVTGGTGTLGRLVVGRLRGAGQDVRVLTRRRHESGDGIEFVTDDLATGEGIEPAVEGVETIVHLAGGAKGDEDKASGTPVACEPE
jgi:NAD dependent epimerase/dehydratase family